MSKMISLTELDALIADKKSELANLETDRAALANHVAGATADVLAGARVRPAPPLFHAPNALLGRDARGFSVGTFIARTLMAALMTFGLAFVYSTGKAAYVNYRTPTPAAVISIPQEPTVMDRFEQELIEVRRAFVDGPQTPERRKFYDTLVASIEAERAEERAKQAEERDKQSRARVDDFIRSIDAAKAKARAEGDAIRKAIRRDDGHYRPLGAEGVRVLGGR